MKRKILMFVLALCMIVPCAVAFSACKKNDYTKNHCKISVWTLPEGVDRIQYSPSQSYSNGKSEYNYFNKNEESTIHVEMKEGYEVKDLSNFLIINKKPVKLVLDEENSNSYFIYKYTFRPTENIEIKFNKDNVGLRVLNLSYYFNVDESSGYGIHDGVSNYRINFERNGEVVLTDINPASVVGEASKVSFTAQWGDTVKVKVRHTNAAESGLYLAGTLDVNGTSGSNYFATQTVAETYYADECYAEVVETIVVEEDLVLTHNESVLLEEKRTPAHIGALVYDGEWVFGCFDVEILQDESNKYGVRLTSDLLDCMLFFGAEVNLGNMTHIPQNMDEDFVLFGPGYSEGTYSLNLPYTYYEEGSQERYTNRYTYIFETNIYQRLMESGTSTPGYETRQCAEEKRHNDVQRINGGGEIYYVNGSIVNNGEYDEFQYTTAIVATRLVETSVDWYEEEQYLIYNDPSNNLWLDIDINVGLDEEYPEEILVNVEFVNGETYGWDVTLNGTYCRNQGDDSVAYNADSKHVYVNIENFMDVAYVTIIPQ